MGTRASVVLIFVTMDHADDGDDDGVFVYMGGDQEVPEDVTHVRVHQSVKIIPEGAFMNCRKLVSIEIHDGVEIIEREAFSECHSLGTIKLAGVRVIEMEAFYECTALENVEFGDKLETIGFGAFSFTSLRNIKLHTVRTIGICAFAGCEQLTEVELSKDLGTIGDGAFYDCSFRRIALPLKENLLDDEDDGEDSNGAFTNCVALSQVELIGGIHKTVSSLLLESWRNEVKDEIDRINRDLPNTATEEKTRAIQYWMERVLERIEHYKSEHYLLLKEFTTLLELALWKVNLDDNVGYDAAAREGIRVTRGQRKRAKKDISITSGASIVIKNVLPFLKLE